MNLYTREFFSDEELVAEIKSHAAARRKVTTTGIASISGEGRRVEFVNTKDSLGALDRDLREMMAEARRRGLPIGGEPQHAIAVELQ